MTTAVQHRRGTTAEHATFTGLEGEVTIDTTKDTAVIHDGVLAGGYPLAKENLANVTTSGLSSIDGASTASDDKFFIYDQSATSLKTITRAELNNAMEQDALANVAITGGTINGTAIGGTTAAAASVTTLTTSSTVTLNGGTANGVAYLNGSKVLTTGSALTFNGQNFGVDADSAFGSSYITLSARSRFGFDGNNVVVSDAGTNKDITFLINTAEQMRLTSTGLGIGTSSPSRKLSVTGTGNDTTSGSIITTNANAGTNTQTGLFASNGTQSAQFSLGGTGYSGYGAYAAGNAVIYNNQAITLMADNGSTGVIKFATGGNSEKMRLDSSGNLGIGTSSPAVKLEVAGDARLTGANPSLQAIPTSSGFFIDNRGVGKPTIFRVSSASAIDTTAATIDSSGNLGLGVTPSAWGVYKAADINTRGLGLAGGDQSYAITCNAYYDGSTWRYKGTSSYRVTRLDSFDGAYVFYTAPSGTAGNAITFTQAMTLDASGNLGIGTSSPTSKLHVATTGTGLAQFTGAQYAQIRHSDGTRVLYTQVYDNQARLFTESATPLLFGTGDAERMRLDSSGNLGIGTSSPSSRLTVKTGTDNVAIRLLENASNQAAIQFTDDPTTVAKATLAWNGSNAKFQIIAGTSSAITFETNGSERARIDSSGNLGLGVTPSAWGNGASLQGSAWAISTTAGFDSAAFSTNTRQTAYGTIAVNSVYRGSAAAASYEQLGGQHRWFTAPSGTAGNAISFTQAMTLDASGNLGIGSTSPLARLNVVGSPDATFNSQIIIGAGGATAQKLTFNPTLSSAIAGLSDGSLAFYGNGANTERARIDSSGNLLVGQTSNGFANNNGIFVNPTASGGLIGINHASGSASGQQYCAFGYNGSQIGSITQSGTTAVLYNVTSDQRLKENIQDADSASALIDSLQVRKYDWKADGSHQRYGFVAQELVTVAPEAVHQPADPDEMMAVDYSKLVPMLVKEVQSLRARVAQLESN